MNSSLIQYIYYDVWHQYHCPLIKDYPLMSTPWSLLLITGIYLTFVKRIGPKYMSTRKPYDLRWPIRVFNAFMVGVNFWGLYNFIPRTNFGLNVWKCPQLCDEVDPYFIWLGYIFFLSRMAEYMDTIFFVLRKKNNQVSNLHVFHHSIVPIAIWSVFKFVPSVENAMYPFINSIVHVIMYLYYTLASFGDRFEPYLKWKKAPFIGCNVSSAYFLLISTALGGIFFYLFYSFYLENYTKSKSHLNNNKKSVISEHISHHKFSLNTANHYQQITS